MANPDFSQESVADQASTGAITVSMPPSWAANQIFVLFVATDGFTPTLSTPNGFVLAQDPAGNTASINAGLGVCGMHIFWKRAVGSTTATDPAPVIAAPSGGGTVQCCHINTYINCRTSGTPFHKIATATVGTATTTINPPGVTTTLNNCTVVSCAASENDDSAFNAWASTGAASPAGQLDNGWHSGALGNNCAWAGGRGGFATAGGPRNCTSTFGASTRQAQITFALASLQEANGTEAGQLSGSTPSISSALTVSINESGQLSGTIPSIAGSITTPSSASVTGQLSGSFPSIAGTVVSGNSASVSGTGSGSSPSETGAILVSTSVSSSGGGSSPSETGTIAVTANVAGSGSGATPGIFATSNPPLALGAAAIRQKANGSVAGFPASGPLTTFAVDPAWTPSTAYSLQAGTRVTNAGNVYECKQAGTSASSGGPTGTGTSIVDGTCQWNFVGPGTGACNTQPSGSLILLSGARGQWATPGTPARDNMGNTFTQVDFQTYAAPFNASAQALYACFNAVGGVGHTATLDYGNPGGQPDECTITLLEIIGGNLIKSISYVEHTTPTANVVTSNPVTTTAEAMIIIYAWLDGVVRTPGTSHLAVFDANFTTVPNATSLLVLDSAGYIQLAVGVFHALVPGTYTCQVTTNNNEGAAMRLVAVQSVDGSVGTEAGQLNGSIPSISGTVVSPDNAIVSGQLSGSSPAESGTVLVSSSEAGQLSSTSPNISGSAQISSSESGQLSGSTPNTSGAILVSVSETNQSGGVSPSITVSVQDSLSLSAQLSGSIPTTSGTISVSANEAGQSSGSVPSIFLTTEKDAAIINQLDGSIPNSSGSIAISASELNQSGGTTPSAQGSIAVSASEVTVSGGSIPSILVFTDNTSSIINQLSNSSPSIGAAVQISASETITSGSSQPSSLVGIVVNAGASINLDSAVLDSSGVVDGGSLFSANIILDDASGTGTASVDVTSSLAIPLDNVSVTASAAEDISGDIISTVSATISSALDVVVSANTGIVLDSATLTSSAVVADFSGNINAAVTIVLDNVTTSARLHVGGKPHLRVTRFIARSFDLDFIDLFWEIESFTRSVDVITAYQFFIYRSESPEGPFDLLAGPFEDQFHFRDFSPNLIHKWRQLYYKLVVIHKPSGVEIEGGVTTLDAEPDLIALEITRQEDVLLRNFTGRRCFLFPVRTFGEKCTCFDQTLNRKTKSNCLLCFDTGFIGGYLRPIDFYMQFDPDAKNPSLTAIKGETQPRNTSGRLISYPPIKPLDIIVEAENKRWKVVTQTQTERLRAVVHQELSLHMIVKGDIEYKLPVNLAELNRQAFADERNFTNPQHIDDNTVDPDLFIYYGKPRGTVK